MIIVAIIATTAGAFFYMQYRGEEVPIYKAETKVLIDTRNPQDFVFYRSLQDISLDMTTQMDLIKTKPVLSSVVKKLGLTDKSEGDPEFKAALDRLQGSIEIQPLSDLKGKASKNPYMTSRIIVISATDPDPKMAMDIANAVAQAYIEQDRLSRFKASQETIKWLTEQLTELRTKLELAEAAFQNFKTREGIITLDSKRTEEINQMSQFSSGYMDIKLNLTRIESIINKIESDSNSNLTIPVALLSTSNLQRLGNELVRLEDELENKRRLGFTDKYPEVVKLKNQIQFIKQSILTELKQQREFLRAQEKAFLEQQEERRRKALSLNAKELQYLTLEREVKTNQELYNTLLAKVKEISLVRDADINNIRIVEPAEMPMFPITRSSKGPKIVLTLAAFLGLFLGIVYAFIVDYLETGIRTPDDVIGYLGVPVLGIVPHIPKLNKNKSFLVSSDNPRSPFAEAYRNLRTNLIYSGANPMKRILVTSATPGEGKSLTAANLALVMSKAEKSVLLIDADLRRPMVHHIFRVDRYRGLSSVLEGELSVEDAIFNIEGTTLNVMPAGRLPKEPAELLSSVKMNQLLDQLSEEFDLIILDTAPILGMTDTIVLSKEVDKTILVIRAAKTSRRTVQMAISSLEQIGVNVYGVILNDVNVKKDRYYHDYYRYYYTPYAERDSKQ